MEPLTFSTRYPQVLLTHDNGGGHSMKLFLLAIRRRAIAHVIYSRGLPK